MLDTKLYADPGRIVLQGKSFSAAPESQQHGLNELQHKKAESHSEGRRIRAIFDLPGEVPLPHVTMPNLARYHTYLVQNLVFPFQAAYAETTYPERHAVRYVTVVGLEPVGGSVSQGIHGRVEGIPDIQRLSLVDLCLLDDDPNRQTVEDFAYWFLNAW